MPTTRIKEIVDMSPEERAKKLVDLRVELARIRTMTNAGGEVENPNRLKILRKTIAQILTVENENKLGIRKSSQKPEKKQKKKAEKPAKKPKVEKETEETLK